tara:strand:- start:5113 stop:5679 length:567 start_codon:yes stop_codon:yes gene_type:complete
MIAHFKFFAFFLLVAYDGKMTNAKTQVKPPRTFPTMSVDLELDPYHPSNQPYVKSEQAIKRVIVDQAACMTPKHVKAAKLHLRGETNVEIAEKLGYATGTVSQILNRNDVIALLRTLRHLDQHHDGLSLQIRKHMIGQMVLDNFGEDDRVALTAMQELNRIEGVYKEDKKAPDIIVINNNLLPRGALD